jgi:hypothetical protein
MKSHRRVLRWYPAAWRDRYGEEMVAFLDDTHGDGRLPWRVTVGLAWAGCHEHLRYITGNEPHRGAAVKSPTFYRISRVTPPLLSLIALAACVAAWQGWVTNPPHDEGALAHIYQLVMVLQCPLIGLFVLLAVRQRLLRDLAIFGGAQLTLLAAAVAALPILKL